MGSGVPRIFCGVTRRLRPRQRHRSRSHRLAALRRPCAFERQRRAPVRGTTSSRGFRPAPNMRNGVVRAAELTFTAKRCVVPRDALFGAATREGGVRKRSQPTSETPVADSNVDLAGRQGFEPRYRGPRASHPSYGLDSRKHAPDLVLHYRRLLHMLDSFRRNALLRR